LVGSIGYADSIVDTVVWRAWVKAPGTVRSRVRQMTYAPVSVDRVNALAMQTRVGITVVLVHLTVVTCRNIRDITLTA